MRRVTHGGYPLVEIPGPVGPRSPHTASFLSRRYQSSQRELAYPETPDRERWQDWRRRLRRAVRRTLCLDQLGPVPTPEVIVLESETREEYVRHRLAYQTLPDNWVSAYLLVPPDGGAPLPAAICPHGHVTGGKEGVVEPGVGPGRAYGHELARRGLVVLAPDNAGMGERDVPPEQAVGHTGCQLAWARLNQMGLDLTGLRIFDLMAGLNLLISRPDVDGRRVGCAGLSGGCWLSQVLAALDRRIKAVVLSGFFTTFAQTVWHGHCICHHPFGIGRLCDMPDLSALIAPRPQFVESGREDSPYPHEPAFSLARRAYELVGAPEQLGLHRYEGGHMFCGEESIPWLVERLGDR